MKILLLHNNNLPVDIINGKYLPIGDTLFEIDRKPLSLPQTDRPDFDTFVSEEMSKMTIGQYELIVMPLNFTEAYIEYTGLRVAAHIRLTEEWNSRSTPILFLGSDNRDDIMRFTLMGEILNTFNVYYSKRTTAEQLRQMFSWINKNKLSVGIDSPEYRNFLNRMKLIPAPANYASHHSIANEWAIMRWTDMITWNEQYPMPTIPRNSFRYMLYFKYLMANAGERDRFTRNYKKNNPLYPRIEGFSGKRIVLIDDEISKGWKELLDNIFFASGAGFVCFPFNESHKSMSKNELIDEIKSFLLDDYKQFGGANCYLLDLRLHDDDFGEDVNYQVLTGHIIAEFIKSENLNPYNQVIIFTASNKVWNYEKAVKQTKACGYVLKESPEQNLTRTDSKRIFDNFVQVVRQACRMSYLRDYYASLKKLESAYHNDENLPLLYQFVDLLNIDNNQKQKSLIRASALTLYAFLESFIEDRFELVSTELIRRDCEYCVEWLGHFYVKYEMNVKNEKVLTDVKTVNDKSVSSDLIGWDKWVLDTSKRNIPKKMLILVPLSLYYNISDAGLRIVLKLIDMRNSMAHEGKGEYTVEELKEVFDNIILPVVRQEACGRE